MTDIKHKLVGIIMDARQVDASPMEEAGVLSNVFRGLVEESESRAHAAEVENAQLKAEISALRGEIEEVEIKPTIGDRDFMKEFIAGRHPSTASLMLHFAWSHYCGDHEDCARQIANVAIGMMHALPDSPELSAGLRKLLEARDCFDRAYVDMDEEPR